MYEKIESFSCQTNIDGENYIYTYFLLHSVKKMIVDNIELEIPCYGIEILREKMVNDRIVDAYSENIKYVSPQKNKVLELLNMLKEYEVSPIHLIDIAGDSVDEWVGDFDTEICSESRSFAFI
jgi:hypothetical protein